MLAAVRNLVELGKQVVADQPDPDQRHEPGGEAPAALPDGTRPTVHQQHQGRSAEDAQQPGAGAEAEHADQGGGGDRQGKQAPHQRRLFLERLRRQARHQPQQEGGDQLLDPTPHRVGEEGCRLRCEEDHPRAQGHLDAQSRGELPERQRREAGQQRQIGLEDPGQLTAGELGTDAEGDEGRDRVPAGDVEVERRLVARRRQVGDVAAVLHQTIGDRKPGRGVVELDVAGEGRLAGEDDRRPEDEEDGQGKAQRPGIGTQAAPLPEGHGKAGQGEQGRQGRGPARGRREGGRRQAEDGDARHSEGSQQGTGDATASERLGQQADTEADGQEQRREDDPGDEHGCV